MANKLRILALEVDSVFETTRERRGTFGDIFHELFTTAGAEHNPPLEVETIGRFVVEPEGGAIPDVIELEKLDVHAVVFSGSKYDAHSDDPWILNLVKWIQGMHDFLFSTLQLSNEHSLQRNSALHANMSRLNQKRPGQDTLTYASVVSASGTRFCVGL